MPKGPDHFIVTVHFNEGGTDTDYVDVVPGHLSVAKARIAVGHVALWMLRRDYGHSTVRDVTIQQFYSGERSCGGAVTVKPSFTGDHKTIAFAVLGQTHQAIHGGAVLHG